MGAYALGMTEMPNPMYRELTRTLTAISLGMFLDLGGADTYDATASAAANNLVWKQSAVTSNNPSTTFDPAVDFGYGQDGEAAWPAW